ncbi:MAG TPA: ATP-binding cassette domain-containing protein [Polyangiaceae bacterium]|nr:ATP-binding cassette domain-containing protein [Polyangiaceae bacterium]
MADSGKKRRGAALSLAHVTKHFGSRSVLSNLSLEVRPGEFVAVVGRSGSGKSTLVRVLCGLEEPSGGSLRLPERGDRGGRGGVRVVFQEPRLLPWKSVLENTSFGIAARDAEGKRATREAALRALDSVGLRDRIHDYPRVLSGGQRQRVALARALLHEPSLMLLDEPFSGLDALTRIEAQRLIESLWLERGFTALLVTHDVSEAVLLADRVLLLEEGAFAATFEVNLPRPRPRDDVEVARIAANVLGRILASPEGGRARRPSEDHETVAQAFSESRPKPAHA